ncbi:hypothetical protein GGR51DRAFT_560408 [Nemania sp. FL0031]|nr:hypothetical protein GGR51DRAFT_560408 [Nemania sp. FL0031]
MAYKLHIPPCICNPTHPFHPPPEDKPLRIQILGPLVSIQRLLPESAWNMDWMTAEFPQPAAPDLARLTYQTLYGHDVNPELANDMVVRDEVLGWEAKWEAPKGDFESYGVTFDHLVSSDDPDPEVLQLNIFELEIEKGPFAGGVEHVNKYSLLTVDPADYIGKKVLAIPRCCQKRKGTTDRKRVNDEVEYREGRKTVMDLAK